MRNSAAAGISGDFFSKSMSLQTKSSWNLKETLRWGSENRRSTYEPNFRVAAKMSSSGFNSEVDHASHLAVSKTLADELTRARNREARDVQLPPVLVRAAQAFV